tara:strand:- start:119 stop:451 length:333 start_codon:yes stop_codon:yes gene_type:complete
MKLLRTFTIPIALVVALVVALTNQGLIAMIIAFALLGGALLIALASGVKGLFGGQTDVKSIAAFAVPFVVFGGSFVATGTGQEAGVITLVVMMVLMVVGVTLTTVRGVFR